MGLIVIGDGHAVVNRGITIKAPTLSTDRADVPNLFSGLCVVPRRL